METLTAILTIAVFILEIVTMIVVIRFCNKAGAYIDYKHSAIYKEEMLKQAREEIREISQQMQPSTEDKP